MKQNDKLEALHQRVLVLETSVEQLKKLEECLQVPSQPSHQLSNLEQSLKTIKLRIGQGRHLPNDNCRLTALESEIGKILLHIDGVL